MIQGMSAVAEPLFTDRQVIGILGSTVLGLGTLVFKWFYGEVNRTKEVQSQHEKQLAQLPMITATLSGISSTLGRIERRQVNTSKRVEYISGKMGLDETNDDDFE